MKKDKNAALVTSTCWIGASTVHRGMPRRPERLLDALLEAGGRLTRLALVGRLVGDSGDDVLTGGDDVRVVDASSCPIAATASPMELIAVPVPPGAWP